MLRFSSPCHSDDDDHDTIDFDLVSSTPAVTDTGVSVTKFKHACVDSSIETSYVISVRDVEIKLHYDPFAGTGGLLWPAAEVLANYLSTLDDCVLRDKKILELGSGTGLVGMSVALTRDLGTGSVLLTDLEQVLPVLRKSIHLNGALPCVQVHALAWGEEVTEQLAECDIVLLADCVYNEDLFHPLMATLLRLLHREQDIAYMSYKKRRKADANFFRLLRKSFLVAEVRGERCARTTKDGITLYTITRKCLKHASI